jgi:hypothetical protein
VKCTGDTDTGAIPKSTVSLSSDPIQAAACTRLSANCPEPLHEPVDQAVWISVSSGCRRGARQAIPLISSSCSAYSVISAQMPTPDTANSSRPSRNCRTLPARPWGQSEYYLHVEWFASELVIDFSWHCERCFARILSRKELLHIDRLPETKSKEESYLTSVGNADPVRRSVGR